MSADVWNDKSGAPLTEGDCVKVVGGIGAIDTLPPAKVIALGHAGDNGMPTVVVEYDGCTCPYPERGCIIEGMLASGKRKWGHLQEWYPFQVQKLVPGSST